MVLSALWVFGATIHVRNEQVDDAHELFQLQYRTCLLNPEKNCSDTVSLQAAMDATANWSDVAFYAFGPAIAGWLVVLIVIRTFRWVSDGFSKNEGKAD